MARLRTESRGKAEALAAKGKYKSALSLYLKMADHRAAAEMYEKLEQLDAAADQYAEAGEFVRAAELLATLDRREEAATMFEKGGDHVRSAEMLADLGNHKQAGQMFEKGQKYCDAARMYEKADMLDAAAQLFQKGGNREDAIRLYLATGKKEAAARLYSETGEHVRAAQIYEEVGLYKEAAGAYELGGMKREAVTAYEKAQLMDKAAALCEELELYEEAARYAEQLGDKARARKLYRQAGRFAEAGRIFEADHLLYDAARMYEQDGGMAARAAELFKSTYAIEPAWRLETETPVSDIAVTPTGHRTVVSLAGPEVVLFDGEGNTTWRFRIPMSVRARSVAVMSDASMIAIGTRGRSVYLLDSSKKLLWKREFSGEVRGVTFQEETGTVIAGCTDNRVKALTREGKDLWTVETAYKVWHVDANQDTRSILVACGDMNLYILDFAGQLVWKNNAGDWVSRVAVNQDGTYAAAVIGRDKLNLYDLEKRVLLWQYRHADVVQDVGFLNGDRLIVGSNAEAFVIDFDQTLLWRTLAEDGVMRVAATSDGTTVHLGHFEQGLQVINLRDCLIRAARNYEQAEMFVEAAAIYEEKNELTRAVELYVDLEDFGKAAALAEKLENVEQAAELYEKAGLFEQAATCFEQLNLIERAASCYAAAGHKSRAGNLLARLGDAVKAAEMLMESGDLLAAGRMFEKAGAVDKALDAYEQAVADGSLDSDGAVRLGGLYFADERFDDAIKLLQPITRDKEFAAQALELLGKCFMPKGMFSLAAECYREALAGQEEINSQNIDLFYGLGCAYEQAGDYDAVRDIFRRILAVDYYYKDVTGRLEHINEMSRIFPTPADGTVTSAGMAAAGQTTVASARPARYEVIRKLGEGGMGVVYLARDTKLDRVVAWKVLPSRLSNNDELRSRFVREARAIAALNHKNIVSVYDIGEERGESFISMEYVEGSSLRDILKAQKSLGVADAMNIAKQVADGLAVAHKAGIIHRDVKPENVMVTAESNEVKVMDFGLARIGEDSDLTGEGAIIGTWRYMAPEQVQGLRAKPATDIYATGIMIFEMIAGEPPFPEGDFAYHHVNTIPPLLSKVAPNVPAGLSAVVKKCLEKDPDNRYVDGTELRRALEFGDSAPDVTVVDR